MVSNLTRSSRASVKVEGASSSGAFQKVSASSIFKNFHLLNSYLVQLDESLRLYHPVIDVSVFT